MASVKIETTGNMAWIISDENLDEEVINELSKACSFLPKSAGYISRENIKKQKDAGVENPTFNIERLRTELFNTVSYAFPAGLIPLIKDLLLVNGISAEVIPVVKGFPTKKKFIIVSIGDWGDGHYGWKHQIQALALSCKHTRGMYKLPTGSGKSILGLKIWEVWGMKLTLVFCPTKAICEQWVKDINTMYPKVIVGKWFGKYKKKIGLINIMTNAKAINILKAGGVTDGQILLDKAKFVLVDECHIVGGGAYGKPNQLYNTLMSLKSIENIYGLSATADMRTAGDNIYQKAGMGDIILEVPPNELIESGILVPPKIRFMVVPPVTFQRKKKNERNLRYHTYQYDTAITYNKERNLRAVKEALRMALGGRQVMVFTRFLSHINQLMQILEEAKTGLVIAWSYGEDPDQNAKIQMFREGKISILIVTNRLLGMGLNIPAISGIVYTIGEKSQTELAQAIGRAMRSHEGKFDCMIVDFADMTEPFSDNVVKRFRYYIDNKYEVDTSNCKWLDRFI
jgi:superfamily II DNA or RNA helicase